ncbi:hypothetical protein AC578_8448 [Pseudocercospora eumusae]|uniref:Cobalamin-independent methionine synthase MetE C-terminal/archaeal domain-containing protein n=1 Tax=Pseudocercospora eumusae TaxID=321146 RepID=A0A139H1U9_9PEZI|nr:hypothetical protein AC578_8448 [Pseudocercospora eumusae]
MSSRRKMLRLQVPDSNLHFKADSPASNWSGDTQLPTMLPTELVGSLPRPQYLHQAYANYEYGRISRDRLEAAQDRAVMDTLDLVGQAGEMFITDGEQKCSSFCTYPLMDTLSGKGMPDNLALDGQYFAIYDDGHHRQLPRLISGPFRYRRYAYDNFQESKPFAEGHLMKASVVSPGTLYLLYPHQSSIPGYPKEAFIRDLIHGCVKDIRGCFDAGAQRVSINCEELRLSLKNDVRSPWTEADLLPTFINLINRVLERFTSVERTNIGIHTCPGSDRDSQHSLEVPYSKLLPSLFKLNAGYFLISMTNEKDKASCLKQIGQCLRRDANGVKQVAFIGTTDPTDPRVESPEEIADVLVDAARWISLDQLGATDDCGFAGWCDDLKPRFSKGVHAGKGGPDWAREVAGMKISNRLKGTRMASERLGI